MKRIIVLAALGLGLGLTVQTSAQGPQQPVEEHKMLKAEVGTWKAEMKMWMPGTEEPLIAQGQEVNKMMGDFWVMSDFSASIMGQPFEGKATLGYDPVKKKYIGTWCDNMNAHMSFMEGTYDKATKTMTMMVTGTGPDGKPSKGKNVIENKDDGSRVFTMYMAAPGSDEMKKGMEITYTKK